MLAQFLESTCVMEHVNDVNDKVNMGRYIIYHIDLLREYMRLILLVADRKVDIKGIDEVLQYGSNETTVEL